MLKRTLKILAGTVLVLVLIAAASVAWVYATDQGTRFVLSRAVAASGDALSIGAIDGNFRNEIVLGDLRYRDASHAVEIDRVSLRLDLGALTRGVLLIEDLRSSIVRYQALAAPDSSGGAARAFDLPLGIQLDRASVEGITIARADGELSLERIVAAGSAAGSAAELARLETNLLGFFLSVQGRVDWSDGLGIDALVSWSGAIEDRQWLGSAELEGRWPSFAVEQELLAPIEQTAAGTVTLGAVPAFDLSVDWAGLGRFDLAGSIDPAQRQLTAAIAGRDLEPAALLPAWPGRLDLNGTLAASYADGYRVASDDLRLTAELGAEQLAVELAGAFDDSFTLRLDRLVATLGANRLEARGELGAALALELSADFADLSQLAALAAREEIQALNESAALATDLTGRATAELALSGSREAPQASGTVALEDSTYLGLPLELAVDFAAGSRDESIVIDAVEARLGASRVSGRGRLGAISLSALERWRDSDAPVELALEADAASLAEIADLLARPELQSLLGRELELTGLAGSATASLALEGSLSRPELAGVLRAQALRYDRYALNESEAEFALGLYAGSAASLRLSAAAPDWSARLAAAGELDGGVFSGSLDRLEIDEPWLGAWTLEAPVALALGPGRVEFADACLVHRDSGVCGSWRYGSADDRLRLTARAFELGVLSPLLPPTVALDGPIAVDASLDMLEGRPNGSLRIDGERIGVAFAMSESDRMTMSLTSLGIEAALDDYALSVDAAIASSEQGSADISLATADIREQTAAIAGRLDVLWPDLSALSLLSPEVGEVDGVLALAIEVAGTAASPELSGSGMLSGGRVSVPQWGILIERIEGEAVSAEGRSLRYQGSGFIEDSEILVSGVTELDPAASWPTRLSLTGDEVPISRRPDATVIASPEFDVDIRLPRIDVNGSVFVPEAVLSVEELPMQAVRASPDSVVHGQAESEPVRPLEVSALVSVELGDRVRYTGSNLDVVLSGGLAVEYQSGRTPIAGGSVSLDGSYQAYGQTLDLEGGELLFAGPLDDPALDVLASRSIGATTVGVRLSGTLKAPVTSLYSDPAMSEANTLSYLIFGRPLRSADDEDTATIEAAALALGVQQALPAVQRVGETLGLDELSIEPTEIDAGSLMAGKYLSPKLYVSYTYGLFNRLGGFLLRYDISDRLSLETRSGSEKAMDLLYSIEKE